MIYAFNEEKSAVISLTKCAFGSLPGMQTKKQKVPPPLKFVILRYLHEGMKRVWMGLTDS